MRQPPVGGSKPRSAEIAHGSAVANVGKNELEASGAADLGEVETLQLGIIEVIQIVQNGNFAPAPEAGCEPMKPAPPVIKTDSEEVFKARESLPYTRI